MILACMATFPPVFPPRSAESAISDAILERRLALLDRALDCAEQSYPMPLPAEFQRAVSSPCIPERAAEALHAFTQQRQQVAQIPATTMTIA
jgi:hypothetical protein